MSFHAILTFDQGKAEGYQVVASLFALRQPKDAAGRPSGEVGASMIGLRLQPTDADTALAAWAAGDTDLRSGKIQYFRRDQESVFNELVFTNAYCIKYKEGFSPAAGNGDGSLLYDIYISAETITTHGVTHKNAW